MDISRKLAELSIKKFDSLPKTGKPKDNEWTILSCIVQEHNSMLEVVSLGTGSKCIGKANMCPKGSVINDSHAEVICRRAFLRYLYDHIKEDSLIFDIDKQTIKFNLKPNIKFHFFTTHVPCGDAAIFPKEQNEDFGNVVESEAIDQNLDEIPAKKIKIDDIFRTGAKCLQEDMKQDAKGEGSAYHVLGVVRTKPGRGYPTSSVSCSDKLAKWCHIGIQGALLMMFLEKPIYLSSFTILNETQFCQQALERTLFKRLENVKLNKPYRACLLDIHIVESQFTYKKKDDRVPCSSSIVWFKSNNDKCLEVVAVNGRKQGVTKKNYESEKGRLKICKLELFKTFVCKVNKFKTHFNINGEIDKLTYRTAKDLSKTYQENWCVLKKKFGVWTSKDPELLQFIPT